MSVSLVNWFLTHARASATATAVIHALLCELALSFLKVMPSPPPDRSPQPHGMLWFRESAVFPPDTTTHSCPLTCGFRGQAALRSVYLCASVRSAAPSTHICQTVSQAVSPLTSSTSHGERTDDERFKRSVGFKEDSAAISRFLPVKTKSMKQLNGPHPALPLIENNLIFLFPDRNWQFQSNRSFFNYPEVQIQKGHRGQLMKTFSTSGWHKLNKLVLAHVGVKRAQNRAQQAFLVLPGKPD